MIVFQLAPLASLACINNKLSARTTLWRETDAAQQVGKARIVAQRVEQGAYVPPDDSQVNAQSGVPKGFPFGAVG